MRVTEAASRDAHLPTAGATKKRAPNADKVQTSDPAPVEHDAGKIVGDPAAAAGHVDTKFEAKDPFRSRKGDRFS